MKGGLIKKGIFISALFICSSNKSFAYSDPWTWSNKKTTDINLVTDFVAKREHYSEKCYKDGHGWSAGFGDFSWCDESIKVLRWKNPLLRLRSDDYVRTLVRMPRDIAKWRLRKYVIEVYDKLEKIFVNGKRVTDVLDAKEILSLVDNSYTRGATRFYNDPLWEVHVKEYIRTGKMNCISVAHAFLKQSTYSKKSQRNGVLARRFAEMMDFTHRSCSYDVKFLLAILNQYRVK
jgi:hypothetical protein